MCVQIDKSWQHYQTVGVDTLQIQPSISPVNEYAIPDEQVASNSIDVPGAGDEDGFAFEKALPNGSFQCAGNHGGVVWMA